MKKILLLMTMALTCVGAWAQAELDGCYVTFTNVQKNGTEYSLYVNDQKQLAISGDRADELGEYSKFICTKVNDQYTFYNEKAGVYMIWRSGTGGYDNGDGTMATYNSTYCNWTLRSSSKYSGGYYIVSKRANGTTAGAIVLMSNGVFDAYGDSEGWDDSYSNVFKIEKVGEVNKTSVEYNVNMTTGSLYNYNDGADRTGQDWNYKWAFNTTPAKPCALTLVATNNANNIQSNDNNMNIYAGKATECTYQLSVPEGYIIESYHFDYVTHNNNAVSITANGSTVQSSTTIQTLAVDNVNNRTTEFTLSGGNYGFTSSNFVVVISKMESNKSFNWNTSTSWADANDLPSTILNDNALGYGIKYIEQEMSVAGARTATVTFQYTSGNCALNVRGVEVIDSEGRIVAGDYHVGKTGSEHTDNVYTVKVAEGGTYTVRCYATFGANDRADATNGSITVAFAYPENSDFSHDVNFAAEYATLHLGYKAAIPAGVEAYVVESANNGWAHMEKIENVIPAATPVVLKLKEGAVATATYTFAYTANAADEIGTNLLKGSIANRYVAENAYVLSNGDDGLGLYLASMNQLNNTAFKNNANKAYLPATVLTSGVKALRFNFDGETTAIETVETEKANAPIYDLSGRRVVNTVKGGIYIQNGKKFIVK